VRCADTNVWSAGTGGNNGYEQNERSPKEASIHASKILPWIASFLSSQII